MSPLPSLSDYPCGNSQRLCVNTCSEEHEIRPSVDFGPRGGFFYFQILLLLTRSKHPRIGVLIPHVQRTPSETRPHSSKQVFHARED